MGKLVEHFRDTHRKISKAQGNSFPVSSKIRCGFTNFLRKEKEENDNTETEFYDPSHYILHNNFIHR